jgi:hypothetical protein
MSLSYQNVLSSCKTILRGYAGTFHYFFPNEKINLISQHIFSESKPIDFDNGTVHYLLTEREIIYLLYFLTFWFLSSIK